MISKIHSTTVVVNDQEAALDFYVNKLEWEKSADIQMGPEMRWLTVVPPGAQTEIALGHVSWFEGKKTPGGQTGISLVTPDIETTVATLTERGVNFTKPIEVMPWGDKATWFTDPEGNEFFLVSE